MCTGTSDGKIRFGFDMQVRRDCLPNGKRSVFAVHCVYPAAEMHNHTVLDTGCRCIDERINTGKTCVFLSQMRWKGETLVFVKMGVICADQIGKRDAWEGSG